MDVSTLERMKGLWPLIEMAVTEAVKTAEAIFGPQTGPEKKKFVKDNVMRLLKELEKSHDVVTGWLEPVLFQVISWALDLIIERVLNKLKSSGQLA
jgi:hypothetical protein